MLFTCSIKEDFFVECIIHTVSSKKNHWRMSPSTSKNAFNVINMIILTLDFTCRIFFSQEDEAVCALFPSHMHTLSFHHLLLLRTRSLDHFWFAHENVCKLACYYPSAPLLRNRALIFLASDSYANQLAFYGTYWLITQHPLSPL